MPSWLEMKPSDFGYDKRKRPVITAGDIKALHTHATRERKRREKEGN